MRNRQVLMLFGLMVFVLMFALTGLFHLEKKFPTKKKTASDAGSCVDHIGNGRADELCGKDTVRTCKIDIDCRATCDYGCVNSSWLKDRNDCMAIPEYSCICKEGKCTVR